MTKPKNAKRPKAPKKKRVVSHQASAQARQRLVAPDTLVFSGTLKFITNLLALVRMHPEKMDPFKTNILDMKNQVAKHLE